MFVVVSCQARLCNMKKCSNVPNMWLDWRCCVGVVGHCQTAFLLFFFLFELCNHMVMCYAAQIITICGEEKYLTCLKMNMYLIYTSCLPFYIFSSCTYIFIKNIILKNSLHISNLHFKRLLSSIQTHVRQHNPYNSFIYYKKRLQEVTNKQKHESPIKRCLMTRKRATTTACTVTPYTPSLAPSI